MNSGPRVPELFEMEDTDAPTWQECMAKLAARYTDAQKCLSVLNNLLAEGKHTANQLRRAEEDCMRTYGLFISALIESYKING